MSDTINATYKGELLFCGYTDSSRNGPRVTFALPDRDLLQAFVGKEGRRFAVMLVELTDEPAPSPAPAPAAPTVKRERMGPLCELAVKLCRDPQFQRWAFEVAQQHLDPAGVSDLAKANDSPEAFARAVVTWCCSVQSRKDLDTNVLAGHRFHARVRRPYMAWLADQGVPA